MGVYDRDVPASLRERVESELEPGEAIRWIGMPKPAFFTGKSLGAFLFGIPWTAFALFWTAGAAGFQFPDFSHPVAFFPLFGVPFILIGFGMLSSPLWAHMGSKRTVYVITDRRAILFEGIRSITIRSFMPEQLHDVYRREHANGTGDVIIAKRAWRDSDNDRHTEEIGFLRVADARMAEQLIKELAKKDTPPSAS